MSDSDASLAGYPGSAASAWQILSLAHDYHNSCTHLMMRFEGEEPQTLAPARLLAIHAIELYLNALMLDAGDTPQMVRGLQHDLAGRAKRAIECGLALRPKTAGHLARLTSGKEYVAARYGPELVGSQSELNRLTATLKEVSERVSAIVAANTEARFASRAPRTEQA
ncbi:hypothetical protein J2Y58_003606 [Sphingomonas sp. BE138]|uniref:hypothetical protein n=1 Tax=Sphingomonas sp. BE138 TaxID=2817845 RepID=UPI0028616BB2|nr:hypothetical protein [Sphingomonas sp. BE138]MDR6790226.1 hypothetical protein [Sphingomonas sp. BE138]